MRPRMGGMTCLRSGVWCGMWRTPRGTVRYSAVVAVAGTPVKRRGRNARLHLDRHACLPGIAYCVAALQSVYIDGIQVVTTLEIVLLYVLYSL